MQVKIKEHVFEVADEPADFWGWVSEGCYNKEFEELLKYLKPEHTFVDLGAWIGSHALLASTVARTAIAFEPDPVAFAILEKNLPASIPAHRIAVSDREGFITLGSGYLGASTTRRNPAGGGGIGAWEEGHICEAPCLTLRQLVDKFNLKDPLFIKMDVEGSEEDIFRDLEFFAERKPTVVIETHPFWWRDKAATWGAIDKLTRIYAGKMKSLDKRIFLWP